VGLKRTIGMVADDQRRAVSAQQRVDLRHEPAAIAKLERVASIG